MPSLPRLTLPVLQELAAQLRFAPPEAVRRAVERIEGLAGDLEPDGRYPADWVVYRVTRYRPEKTPVAAPALVAGTELLAELSAFAERLCDAARIHQSELLPAARPVPASGEQFVTPDALAAAWGISRKTLDRCRKKGLIARRVIAERGKVRLLFQAGAAEAFRARHAAELAKAAGFSRIDPALELRMLRRAERYRARFGCSLNEAAKRLSLRFERSHEAVRQLLKRHARNPGSPAPDSARLDFGTQRPLQPRERAIAYRAWRRAIEPGTLAKRLGHAKPAISRAILLERLARLRAITPQLDPHIGPSFGSAGTPHASLEPSPVRTGLGGPGAIDLASFLAAGAVRVVPVGAEESARAIALQFLMWRAMTTIGALSHLHPSALRIDRAETDLRWASRLQAELVRSQIPLVLQTLEGRLGVSLRAMRPMDAAELLRSSVHAVADVVRTFDPFRAAHSGARLAGSVSPAVTRIAAQWSKDHPPAGAAHRAAAVYSSSPGLADWTMTVSAWQSFLEPDPRVRRNLMGIDADRSAFLAARFGWDGGPPHTLIELATRLHMTPMRAGTIERLAIRASLQAARAGG